MHKEWSKAAKKAGIEAQQIPDILAALQVDDPEHPSAKQLQGFTSVCQLVSEGQQIAAAAAQVIAADEQLQEQESIMATRDDIRQLYPDMEDDYLNQCLVVLGIEDKNRFSKAVLEEFQQLYAFANAGEFESWEEIQRQWQEYRSQQPTDQISDSGAITVSEQGVIAAQTTIPEAIRPGLAAPILETVEEDAEEIPGKMALAQQQARSNVMGGLEGFVQTTYYQGIQEQIQTDEFAEKVREALRSGKSQSNSKS